METLLIFLIITSIPVLIGLMKIFEKAGQPGWAAFVPFYNAYIWLKVIEKPMWWYLFILIPFINIFMLFLMLVETAKTFNKNELKEQALAVLVPFYYFPYLGFTEKEKYQTKEERPVFKKTKIREWTDAIIFAVVAASIIRMFIFEAYTIPTPSMEKSMLVGDYLFVSKFTYGPRMPNTPLSFPFVHHTLPLTKNTKSYLEWIRFPYHRFFAFKKVKNNDIVVFNYPDGDTVATNYQNQSYYALVRNYGWQNVNNPHYIPPGHNIPMGEVIARPVDKRENYIKRCIAVAGDDFEIRDQQVYINGQKAVNPEKLQYQYFIVTKSGTYLTKRELERLDINDDDINMYFNSISNSGFHNYVIINMLQISNADSLIGSDEYGRLGILTLTAKNAEILKRSNRTDKVIRLVYKAGIANPGNEIFPFDQVNYPWNQDNFGPLHIPAKGETVKLNMKNIAIYKRIIDPYEGHQLEIKDNKIYIDGQETDSYTFKMNYYWMMGDNRHNSADSRFWGFVPEDHISGTPLFIWFSRNKDRSLTNGGIRWNRIFMIPE